MKYVKTYMLAMLGTALLAACQKSDYEDVFEQHYYITPDQRYGKVFSEIFSTIGSGMTWITASEDTVYFRINTPEPTVKVQLYTGDPRGQRSDCFLLAEREIPTATDSVPFFFDTAQGLNYVYAAIRTSDGARLVRPVYKRRSHAIRIMPQNKTAGAPTLISPSSATSSYPFASKYYKFTFSDYQFFNNCFNAAYGMTTSFEYLSQGSDIYIIPFGNSAESGRTLYYYTYNPTAMSKSEVRQMLESGEAQGTMLYSGGTQQVITDDASGAYQTKPYILRNLPAGHRVLFYTQNARGERLYSVSALNYGTVVAGAMCGTGHTFVRFDQTGSNASVNNLSTSGYSDLAFCLYGGSLLDYEEDANPVEMGYSLALEAPVDTADINMDFNDAVVRVHHVSGSSVMHVVPVAVGEDVPIGLSYNGQLLREELHACFGVGATQLVNTSDATMIYQFDTITVDVPEDFRIREAATLFSFSVSPAGGTVKNYTIPTATSESQYPRVMLLASPRWNWPLEGVDIYDSYTRMKRWVVTPDRYTTWYCPAWEDLNNWINQLPEIVGDSQIK